jgi:hypothetical protein
MSVFLCSSLRFCQINSCRNRKARLWRLSSIRFIFDAVSLLFLSWASLLSMLFLYSTISGSRVLSYPCYFSPSSTYSCTYSLSCWFTHFSSPSAVHVAVCSSQECLLRLRTMQRTAGCMCQTIPRETPSTTSCTRWIALSGLTPSVGSSRFAFVSHIYEW